jgi:hypothetical protein
MLVRVCDWCNDRVGKNLYVLDGFRLIVNGDIVAQVCDKDFCSSSCLEAYIFNQSLEPNLAIKPKD